VNRRKLIGLLASVVVAGLGTLVLLKYANSSKPAPQAAISEPTVPVLKVQRLIAKGTPAESIGDAVMIQQIPVSQKLNDAADNIALLTGLVASTDLLPNEQVIKARFIPAAEQRKQEIGSGSGLIGVWVTLEPIRALNGSVKVNDTVAVFGSFSGVTAVYPTPPDQSQGSPSTHLILHKVPVLDVVGAVVEAAPSSDGQSAPATPAAPTIQVKLGVDAPSAERLVMLASFGQIWLGSEDIDVAETGTKVVDRSNVYEPTPRTTPADVPKPEVVGGAPADDPTSVVINGNTPTATPVSATKPAAAAAPAPAPAGKAPAPVAGAKTATTVAPAVPKA